MGIAWGVLGGVWRFFGMPCGADLVYTPHPLGCTPNLAFVWCLGIINDAYKRLSEIVEDIL